MTKVFLPNIDALKVFENSFNITLMILRFRTDNSLDTEQTQFRLFPLLPVLLANRPAVIHFSTARSFVRVITEIY